MKELGEWEEGDQEVDGSPKKRSISGKEKRRMETSCFLHIIISIFSLFFFFNDPS